MTISELDRAPGDSLLSNTAPSKLSAHWHIPSTSHDSTFLVLFFAEIPPNPSKRSDLQCSDRESVQAPSFKIYRMTCRVLRRPETPNKDPKTHVLFQRPVNYMQFRDHSQECSSCCRSPFSGLRRRSLHLPKRLAATDLWEETQEAHIQHAGHFTIRWKCRSCDATKEP